MKKVNPTGDQQHETEKYGRSTTSCNLMKVRRKICIAKQHLYNPRRTSKVVPCNCAEGKE